MLSRMRVIIGSPKFPCYPREHVLESLQEAAQVMLEMMMEHNDPLPAGIELHEIIPGNEVAPGPGVATVEI